MHETHLILCGGVTPKKGTEAKTHSLQLGKDKKQGQIYFDTESITKKMMSDLPAVLKDLLEVATYVYVADQIVSRGGNRRFDYGKTWNRRLRFKIPVRENDIWSNAEVTQLLEDTLSFASGDTYRIEFVPLLEDKSPEFFNYSTDIKPEHRFEEVVLFSGGLDSFAGAMEEIVGNGRLVVLVSHQSNNKLVGLQRRLYEYILDLFSTRLKPLHIPVIINKKKELTRETSQRTRSILYASLGASIAHMFDLNRVKFYENGIVSCNLSFDGQTPQARSTRSTHPKLLHLLSKLVSAILETDFRFENPYFGKTKTEVCLRLKELQHEACIRATRSCAKSTYRNPEDHCGICSQCIDRRFATLASECQEYDPQWRYALDIFRDELTNTHDRTMAAGFVGFANQLEGMTRDSFVRRFSSEALEIAKWLGVESREVALNSLLRLHQRHAQSINVVMEQQLERHASSIRKGILPDTCLISMVASKKHLNVGQMLKEHQEKPKKHGKGDLENEVRRLLQLHRNWSAERIATEIGNTTADAVRHTQAWKNRRRRH